MLSVENREALVALGFTSLEADIYTYLVSAHSATGYKIAQVLGKPSANTYKAIESLHQKGMIMVEDGDKRYCRAIPMHELLKKLDRRFRANILKAEEALSSIGEEKPDDRIYHLRTCEQVMDRCRSMLERAEQIVMIDIYPDVLDRLRGEIEAAVSRGVKVNMIAYKPVGIEGVEWAIDSRGEGVHERWPVQCVEISIDAKEQLIAYLSFDFSRVYDAIWSTNVTLAWLNYISIHSECTIIRAEKILASGGSIDEIGGALRRYRSPEMLEAPGYKILRRCFEESGPGALE